MYRALFNQILISSLLGAAGKSLMIGNYTAELPRDDGVYNELGYIQINGITSCAFSRAISCISMLQYSYTEQEIARTKYRLLSFKISTIGTQQKIFRNLTDSEQSSEQ